MTDGTVRIALLGATGSIGRQTLEVIDHLNTPSGPRYRVHALAADNSIDELAALARKYEVSAVACAPHKSPALSEALADTQVKVLAGEEGMAQLVLDPAVEVVVVAVYGLAAIGPLLSAVEHGKRIALASKEALVAAGRFIMEAARNRKATLVPVDSEHSALFQLLDGRPRTQIKRVILTASGGPFRGLSRTELEYVSYAEAQAHPTWSMGAGITLNSATLFNKGLEVIEAHHLFGLAPEQIDVLIEPTSRVHALVELVDGSLLMHAGTPDMRVPIQYALTWPDRPAAQGAALDLTGAPLEFHAPDADAFPALAACRAALNGPWWLPAALITANEELSARFERGELGFLAIGDRLAALAADPAALGLGELAAAVYELPRVVRATKDWVAAAAPAS